MDRKASFDGVDLSHLVRKSGFPCHLAIVVSIASRSRRQFDSALHEPARYMSRLLARAHDRVIVHYLDNWHHVYPLGREISVIVKPCSNNAAAIRLASSWI